MGLNLSGQNAKADQIRPYFLLFRDVIEKRRPIWDDATPEQRASWLVKVMKKNSKDPLFKIFVQLATWAATWKIDADN